MSADLETALAALREGDGPRALRFALSQWRATPDPALTRIVLALSDALSPAVRDLREVPELRRPERWRRMLGAARVEDLERLLEALLSFEPPQAAQNMRLLSERAPDPRLERWLLDQLSKPQPPTRLPIFNAAAEVIVPRDPELKAQLDQLLKTGALEPRLTTIFEAAERAPNGEALHEDARALLPALTAQAQAQRTAALFAQIYAAPQDDAPRAVLGDLLMEAEDPRGEFIQLQLSADSPTSSARQAQLLEQHREAWLGPLAPALEAAIFRRGLLAEVTLGEITPHLRKRLVGRAEWATVETITISRWSGHAAKLIGHSPLRALRAMYKVHSSQLLAPRIARVQQLSLWVHPEHAGALLPACPQLEELELLGPIAHPVLMEWLPRLPALQRLRMQASFRGPWVGWALTPQNIARVELVMSHGAELCVQGETVVLRSTQRKAQGPYVLRQAISDLQAPWVRSVVVEGVKSSQLRDAVVKTFGPDAEIKWASTEE